MSEGMREGEEEKGVIDPKKFSCSKSTNFFSFLIYKKFTNVNFLFCEYSSILFHPRYYPYICTHIHMGILSHQSCCSNLESFFVVLTRDIVILSHVRVILKSCHSNLESCSSRSNNLESWSCVAEIGNLDSHSNLESCCST